MTEALAHVKSLRERAQFLASAGLRYAEVQAWEQALELHEMQLSWARETADPREIGLALAYKAQALHALGQLPRATQAFDGAIDLLRQTGDKHMEGRTLLGLARVHRDRGQADDAARYYESTRGIARTLEDRWLLQELDSDGFGP